MFDSLLKLAEQWERLAKRAWYDAENEKCHMGKKVIETGAIVYQNCARELRESLASLPQPSEVQEGGQE
jgi:hypothetical protein